MATLLYFLCIPLMYFSMVYPLLFKTKTIGVNLLVTIVDNSWTVSCLKGNLNTQYAPCISACTYKLPSPTKRMVLPNWRSLAPQAAPRVAPTVNPILPHKT